ncbi:MAG: hypothetical protein U0Y96_17205 [Candidatus Kapaibacterium sp.]|nr:hypothetical protein [Bacteroidota bacterium]
MIKYFVLCLSLCVITITAQEVPPIQVGVYTGVKGDVNAGTIPSGWKTLGTFASIPDIGISGKIPFYDAYALSALIDIGCTASAFGVKPFYSPTDSNTNVLHATYLGIAPQIMFQYGFLGLNIGIPLSAAKVAIDGNTNEQTYRTLAYKSDMSTLIEFRLGGMLPFIEDAHGVLSGYIIASYQLNGAIANFTTVSPLLYPSTPVSTENNPKNAGVCIGLRYMFNWVSNSEPEE